MSLVINWYQRKTRSILQKYGPGPRVHYHMGIVPEDLQPGETCSAIRMQMTQSQEDMMYVASHFWGLEDLQGQRLLDVGAGLGGASLWMAEHKSADVDALVQFTEHAQWIRSFALAARVEEHVRVFRGDAHTFRPQQGRYDVIMAMESPCYFHRESWFRHVDSILAEGGVVCLEDALVHAQAPSDARPRFDAYWETRVGSSEEYMEAAWNAGFVGEFLDLTKETAAFWHLSAAWIQKQMEWVQDPQQQARYQRSLDSARFHHAYWMEGHYQIRLFRFRRASEAPR